MPSIIIVVISLLNFKHGYKNIYIYNFFFVTTRIKEILDISKNIVFFKPISLIAYMAHFVNI